MNPFKEESADLYALNRKEVADNGINKKISEYDKKTKKQ